MRCTYSASKFIGASTTGMNPARVAAIGHDFAQIRIQNVRTTYAHYHFHVLLAEVADLEYAGLCDFDQKHRLLADLRRDRRGEETPR